MKFLLVRLSSLGDVILTTPAIRALRDRYPDASIDFAVYDRFSVALSEHPEIDKLLICPKKELKRLLKERRYWTFLFKLGEFFRELRQERYDYVIDLHNVTESALIALMARSRVKAGHKRQLLSLFFDSRSAFDDGFATSDMHAAETGLRFLVDAGCLKEADLPRQPRLEYYLPDAAATGLDLYLAQAGLAGRKMAGINPCSSYAFKRWGEEGFAAVADYLAEAFGYEIVVFGSPAEQEVVRSVMAKMKSKAYDTSHLPVFQAFELIRRLDVFVTNDSAPMHIAAAFGTPLVAIHGPINVSKFGPLSDAAKSITKDLPCVPCNSSRDCAQRECFTAVTPEEVFLACRELIGALPKVNAAAAG